MQHLPRRYHSHRSSWDCDQWRDFHRPGNKIIHPFSDFLLHDVGTGDGIVQGGPQDTQHKLRTAPLWGVRTKSRLMHDLKSESFEQAILRHQNEASNSISLFKQLTPQERGELLKFLSSL
jgi:CxxC motif-containing protein (DUF1111 family)